MDTLNGVERLEYNTDRSWQELKIKLDVAIERHDGEGLCGL